jgi:hypothetical protein
MTKQKNVPGTNIIIGICAIVFFAIALGIVCYQQAKLATDSTEITNLQSQLSQRPITTFASPKGVTTKVVMSKQTAVNPLTIAGLIPGNWSFEAAFPVLLKNGHGDTIAHATAQVQGDWMTSQLRPFSATLGYPASETGQGTLVIQKDNPSGLSENDDAISIPVEL